MSTGGVTERDSCDWSTVLCSGLIKYRDDDKDYHPLEDREFIGKLVGLRTNASNVPQAEWLKNMFDGKVSDWAWQRRDECSGE